ncbi:TonB C-terminal domain-containing protein, partial [bacterium]|nr:TonB C-terminal domain-containing protein [bacterium]
KEQTPINKNTKYRADKNSRAGGKHDPKRKVSMPKAGGSSSIKKQSSSKPQQTVQKSVNKTQVKQQNQPPKSLFGNKQTKEASPAKVEAPTPSRPSLIPKAPKIAEKPKSNITIPVPKATNIPDIGTPAGTGPIASPNRTGSGAGNKVGTAGSGNGLSFAPTTGGSTGKTRTGGTGSGNSTGTGIGNGNIGNPGPGNPNGRPGIDAIKEPDFGPYMRELQQRIKRNWEPPKGEESRRVVLLFSIARDGRLLSVKVSKSSGLTAADNAAINAVKLTAPFKTLPPEYKGNSVDIQFTFDYNVFGAKKYN